MRVVVGPITTEREREREREKIPFLDKSLGKAAEITKLRWRNLRHLDREKYRGNSGRVDTKIADEKDVRNGGY